ncbi:MAG: hypothetical protein U1F26_06840 [Lysobacterales bacterium]
MIELRDLETGSLITTLSEDDLAFLVRELEEESGDDQDYYIDIGTLQLLAEAGGNRELLKLLGQALGAREGMEVVWRRLG